MIYPAPTVLMCCWFAPSKLRITFETQGMGAFTPDELDRYVVRDADGTPVALDLPTQFVLIANHQVRIIHALRRVHAQLCCAGLPGLVVRLVPHILHESARGAPVRLHHPQEEPALGPRCWLGECLPPFLRTWPRSMRLQGMQFFKFIFLARSWASDRRQLAVDLASLGREAEREGKPLCFILYPEGTLVSKDTRPRSKKYADKIGIVSLHPLSSRPARS